jgi:ArsR family transcriptional regulator, arsenate/arsenite/antimonite-responsive transcriptional repressor
MWDRVFKALSDPQRRAILKRLRHGPLTASEIGAPLAIRASTLSHHLNLLKAAELVRCEKRATQRVYSLNTSVFEDLATEVLDFRHGGH